MVGTRRSKKQQQQELVAVVKKEAVENTQKKENRNRDVTKTPEKKKKIIVANDEEKYASPEMKKDRKSILQKASAAKASPVTPKTKSINSVGRPNEKRTKERQARLNESFLVVSSRKNGKEKGVATPTRKLFTMDDIPTLKGLYSFIRRKTGALGGGGAGGAIYGEITESSFQKVVDCLKSKCEFGKDSTFLDIGSGLGKPNFHVRINPGVKFSLGVELIGGRWWQSMCLLNGLLQEPRFEQMAEKVFFGHANVLDMDTFDPITHVYSFNRGFPPEAMRAIAKSFHASETSKYFICFDKLSTVKKYGFDVTLVDYVTTKMAGSGEQHRCFIFKKNDEDATEKTKVKETEVKLEDWKIVKPPRELEYSPHVPLGEDYLQGMDCLKAGSTMYQAWVENQVGLSRSSRRSRRAATATIR